MLTVRLYFVAQSAPSYLHHPHDDVHSEQDSSVDAEGGVLNLQHTSPQSIPAPVVTPSTSVITKDTRTTRWITKTVTQAVTANNAVPADYLRTTDNTQICGDRFSLRYLERFKDTSAQYCHSSAASAFTCWHASAEPHAHRIESMCMASNAIYDPTAGKFQVGCKVRELDAIELAHEKPQLANLHQHWHETGPSASIAKAIQFAGSVSVKTQSHPPEFTILLRREGPGNVFHCMMELMAMAMTMDVLQMAAHADTGGPYWTLNDAPRTQVVLLDDYAEGPWFPLWNMFAEKPTLRIADLAELVREPQNVILPLAGGANPLWHGNWESLHCSDASTLSVFSRRVLSFCSLPAHGDAGSDRVRVLIIDRPYKRRFDRHDISRRRIARVLQAR